MPVSADALTRLYPIDVEFYVDLVESGVLDDRRLELVDGVFVEMNAMGQPHEYAAAVLGAHFVVALSPFTEWVVTQQGGFVANETSVPEPDLSVKPRAQYGTGRRRPPSDPALVGEVSYSSLAWDLGRKRVLYAEAGVPEYWVVDLVARRLLVHRDPSGGDYRTVTEHLPGVPATPAALPVGPFDVAAALLPSE